MGNISRWLATTNLVPAFTVHRESKHTAVKHVAHRRHKVGQPPEPGSSANGKRPFPAQPTIWRWRFHFKTSHSNEPPTAKRLHSHDPPSRPIVPNNRCNQHVFGIYSNYNGSERRMQAGNQITQFFIPNTNFMQIDLLKSLTRANCKLPTRFHCCECT